MNREIKFRIWDTEEKRFVRWDLSLPNGDVELNELFTGYWNRSKNYVFQQYTGIKDGNGKEIYEGDIMASRGNYITDDCDENGKYPDLFCVVVWNTKMSRFGLTSVDEYKSYKDDDISRIWCCSITTFKEAVGNVFENSVLLK